MVNQIKLSLRSVQKIMINSNLALKTDKFVKSMQIN